MDEAFSAGDIGKRVLVWGDDLYCLSTSLFLSHLGKEIIAVEVPRFFPLDVMEVTASALYLRVMLAERGVESIRHATVSRIADGHVTLSDGRRWADVDAIVVCKLVKDRRLEKSLRSAGIPARTIGDARWPRKSLPAACEAFELATRI